MMLRTLNQVNFTLSRCLHVSAPVSGSVFMKRQKKVDPEVAKVREARKRKKLEREIRLMQKNSKKPKPVEEMCINAKAAENISERTRDAVAISEAMLDERALILKDYTRFCHKQRLADEKWLARSIQAQNSAMNELKRIAPDLYNAAIQLDTTILPSKIDGPSLTPPLIGYNSPDGEYLDTTKSWTEP